jgi:acyl-CoA synthetase
VLDVATTPFDDEVIRRFTAAGWWSPVSLSTEVADLASGPKSAAPAYLTADGALSWRGYDDAATHLEQRLRALGRPPGSFVGVFLADSPATHVAYLAIERAGLTIVGIGPRSGQHEIRHLMATTQAAVLLTDKTLRGNDQRAVFAELAAAVPTLTTHVTVELIATGGDYGTPVVEVHGPTGSGPSDAAPRGPNDVFMVNATSGTTGLPKCVQHTQNRWRRFAQHAVEAGELGDDAVLMSVLPSPFGFGLWSAHFLPVLLGRPVVLMDRWDASGALDLMRQHGVTMFAGVTTQLMMLLDRMDAGHAGPGELRAVFTGGEPVPYERARRFEELTGAPVLQFYGSNESGALSCTTVHDDQEHRLRTAGRILPEMDVELADPETGAPVTEPGTIGQPTCWGPLMTPGYLADPVANAALFDERNRVRMPDLATISADGYLTVSGRVADIIIRGGMNISAADVEAALVTHPAIELAAVVGAPHETFGEQVAAFVQLRKGDQLTMADLQAHLSVQGLAKHTWPEQLYVLDELPRNTGEKIAKGTLRASLRPAD